MRPTLKRGGIAAAVAMALGVAAWLPWPPAETPDPVPAQPPPASAPPPSPAPTPAPRLTARRPDAGGRPKAPDAEDLDWLNDLRSRLNGVADRFQVLASLERNAAKASELVDHLCEENAKLSRHPPFHELDLDGGSPRDAAGFMASKVDYEPNTDGTPLAPPGSLHLPEELLERIRGYGSDWPTKMTPQDFAGVDFSWMQQLQSFDSWSLLGADPLASLPPGPFQDMPIPNLVVFQQWAKMRLIKGIQDGDFAAAAAEVEHLADVIHTQGLLIDDMVAASLLRMEAKAAPVAQAAGVDTSNLNAMDADAWDLYRRVDFSSIAFFLPGVSPDVARKASGCAPAGCSTIAEALTATTTYEAATFGVLGNNRDLLLQMAHDRHCDPNLLNRLTSAPPGPPSNLAPLNLMDRLIPDGGW